MKPIGTLRWILPVCLLWLVSCSGAEDLLPVPGGEKEKGGMIRFELDFFPALGIAFQLYSTEAFNTLLTTAGGTELKHNFYYYSSTSQSINSAYYSTMNASNQVSTVGKKGTGLRTRGILAF